VGRNGKWGEDGSCLISQPSPSVYFHLWPLGEIIIERKVEESSRETRYSRFKYIVVHTFIIEH
jgi:hypothetical protein